MRVGCALAAAAVYWLSAQPGLAQPSADRLLVIEPLPDGVSERIAGQTADLAWTIDHARADARGVAAATRLAEEHTARAVLWVTQDASGFVLRLFDARKRRVLERRFERQSGGGAQARSAALESLALALRSSLRALAAQEDVGQAVSADGTLGTGSAEGGTGGAETSGGGASTNGTQRASEDTDDAQARDRARNEAAGARARAEEEDGDARTDEDADEDVSAPPGPSLGADATSFVVAAGWGGALDGPSPLQHGPWARAGVAFDRIELAAAGDFTLGADVRDMETVLHVQRADALASAALDLLQAARARLAIAFDLGVASFARETRVLSAALSAKPAAHKESLALGLEVRASVQLLSSRTLALELELGAGLLALPAAPVLRYQGANGQVEHAIWLLEPQLRLGPRLRIAL